MSQILNVHHTLSSYFYCLFLLLLIGGISADDNGFLGCYRRYDGLERIRKVHQVNVQNCVEACEEENKPFALLATIECFCSNSKDDRDIEENAKCLPCSASENEICGGFGVVAYYKTNIECKFSSFIMF